MYLHLLGKKELKKIIEVFDYIIKYDNNIKLVLLSPGYDLDKYEEYKKYLINKYSDRISIIGKLNKYDYAILVRSSLCVLTTTYQETF